MSEERTKDTHERRTHTNGKTKNVPRLNRVFLNNPDGCKIYEGTIKRTFKTLGRQWADVEWDIAISKGYDKHSFRNESPGKKRKRKKNA